MNIATFSRSAALVLALTPLVAAVCSANTILYRETFSSTGNNLSLSTWNGGWELHRSLSLGGTATSATATATVVSNATGRPSDVAPINAGTYSQDVTGLLFAGGADMREALFFTSEYNFQADALGSVSWFRGSGNAAVEQRAAVQVGSQW
jgi:hypothetical protein